MNYKTERFLLQTADFTALTFHSPGCTCTNVLNTCKFEDILVLCQTQNCVFHDTFKIVNYRTGENLILFTHRVQDKIKLNCIKFHVS